MINYFQIPHQNQNQQLPIDTSSTQQRQQQSSSMSHTLYQGINTMFKDEIYQEIATCINDANQYDSLSAGLKASSVGEKMNTEILVCDHDILFYKGICEDVGINPSNDADSICQYVDYWINNRGLQNEPRPGSPIFD